MKLNTDNTKRIVIKVGTSTLTYDTGLINIRRIEELVKAIADLKNRGKQVILVSSGAISCGLAKVGFPSRDKLSVEQKQAAAAVGQCVLIDMYDKLFSDYGHKVAQILLTKDVIDNELRCSNAKNTFNLLLNMDCIPIVNENDTVSSEQISIGSNDTLSAIVAVLTDSDLLINMSDVDGLYTENPRENPNAGFIEKVDTIDDTIEAYAGGAGTARGTGGMIVKLEAAKTVSDYGIPMLIINGYHPKILYDIFEGEFKGTYFAANRK
ncbi:MAG: glutamate 5-kinase [Eubacteriales bacterium]|nr:glutamate 5-kinase [Eubacteriales bacterium]MDD4421729.1 glutamate 5-kinase [Eubacteriales bacterium]HBR32972.1 glutamate 5-kinase [Clostridiales bacterium]